MLTDAVRRRIEALNRAPLAGAPNVGGGSTVAPALSVRPPRKRVADVAARPVLRLLDEGEVVGNASGEHLRMLLPLARFWPQSEKAVTRGLEKMATVDLDRDVVHPELSALAEGFPHGAMFLDLETCGFAGSMIFLVGLLREIEGQLMVELLLARNYAEEPAVLESLWQVAAEHQVLVTFNGKSFDWPMVHDRSTLHHLGRDARWEKTKARTTRRAVGGETRPGGTGRGLALGRYDLRPEPTHCDLLHHARRRWKGRLPNCRLQTLERYVCGRRREGDVPGSMIPATYHHYVRSGQTTEMESVLAHNAIDLVTLLDLALRLAG